MMTAMDPKNLFTKEDILSDYYRLRNEKGKPKRVKFLIFSSFKPALDVDKYFDKRRMEDSNFNLRDVDYLYLKENLIDRYATKVDNEDHLDIYQNIPDTELIEKLASLEKDDDLWYYDSFLFVFLTYISPYGSENGETKIHFYNSEVTLEKLWECVSKIPAMLGKPKVFLVQADDVRLMEEPPRIIKSGAFGTLKRKIPKDSDRLTILSVIPGKHFVDGDDPSFLIQAFVEVLNENEDALEPLDMFSMVPLINQKVLNYIDKSTVKKTQHQAGQLVDHPPCSMSTLRKQLII